MRALLAVAMLAAVSPAWAHALLRTASPRVGSSLATSPAEVALDFSEAVEPRFCSVVVTNAAGTRVDRDDLHGAGAHLAVGVGPLPPGSYTVTWHAVSVDTHRTEGRFGFTVGP